MKFSEKVSNGLSRPTFKFVSQMIYGMLTCQSCHLSKIARALNEDISLKKTIDRLSHNLSSFKNGEKLIEKYVSKIKNVFTDRTILLIDGSDITKPCRPNDDMNLVVCYGFGKTPLMLITNLKSDDKRLAVAVTKVYLMRWRIEEFYRFKKQQLDFEGFRVRSLNSIRTLDLLLTIAIGYIGLISEKQEQRRLLTQFNSDTAENPIMRSSAVLMVIAQLCAMYSEHYPQQLSIKKYEPM